MSEKYIPYYEKTKLYNPDEKYPNEPQKWTLIFEEIKKSKILDIGIHPSAREGGFTIYYELADGKQKAFVESYSKCCTKQELADCQTAENKMRNVVFEAQSFDDFVAWSKSDKKTYERIVALIADAIRQPFSGIGNPEPLKHELRGYWSRRITDVHRLVYKATADSLIIISCKYHY
jgi:toxin YoeB